MDRTPFFTGFMTILHGDNRVYNNIFVQNWPVEEIVAKEGTEDKEDMGFIMKNNQVVGTSVFDEYPTYEEWIECFEMDNPTDMIKLMKQHFSYLPVWINGNAYFNGAKAWKKEDYKIIDNSNTAIAELKEKDGKYYINTNIHELLGEFKNGIITSDILGKAFEPEQRFEDPDGTSIIFSRDFMGEHRGFDTIPGPFAVVEEARKQLW